MTGLLITGEYEMIERFDLLEKRGYGFIIGFVDNLTGKHLSEYDMMKLANELSDENEHLKSELGESKKAHSNCDKLWWELHDEKEQLEKENEKLKEENKKLEQENEVSYKEIRRIIKEGVMPHQNKIQQLRRENEQLKSICQDHRDHAIDFKADCIRLEKENEQLKSENNMLKVTIVRNEAYIKKLTETSEWHC